MSVNAEFIPASNVVTAITNEITPTVTTLTDHGYGVGQYVRLYIPQGFGMQQANFQQTLILSIPAANTFVCDLNTSLLTPFAIPMGARQTAQVVPVGEVALTLQGSKRNVLGDPIDISF